MGNQLMDVKIRIAAALIFFAYGVYKNMDTSKVFSDQYSSLPDGPVTKQKETIIIEAIKILNSEWCSEPGGRLPLALQCLTHPDFFEEGSDEHKKVQEFSKYFRAASKKYTYLSFYLTKINHCNPEDFNNFDLSLNKKNKHTKTIEKKIKIQTS
jgi:hypothetical protein